jgi:hypothetical protein
MENKFSIPVVTKFRNKEDKIVETVQYNGDNFHEIVKMDSTPIAMEDISVQGLPVVSGQIVVKDSRGYFSIWSPSAFQVMFKPIE